jgi:multiple sugar transport system substrate-binding protein
MAKKLCLLEETMRKDKALLALTILLLVACNGKTTSAPVLTPVGPSGGLVSISFAVPDWELELGYLNRLVKEFEAQNPGIRVGLKSFNEILDLPSGEFYPTDDFWFKLASAADVFQVIFVNGIDRQAVRDGLVRDLKPFIDADPTFHAYDFYPGALEATAWDGGIWAMPTALNYELILFDKEAFDAAGVAYPEIGWTWDDFLAKARSLTVRSGDQVTYWGFVRSDFMFRPAIFIELRTGPLLDEATTPPTPRFTDAEVAKAVQWWADLVLKDQVMPYQSLPETSDDGSTLVEQGIAAMAPNTLPGSRWVRHNQLQKVGVVPYPIGAPDSRTTPIHFEQVAMSAGTAHPEAAWRWLGFLSRQPPSHGQVPARRSVAEANGFWDELDEELASALHFAMDHATRPSLADWGVAYEALNAELRAVFEGKKSVEEALVAAQVQAMADLEAEAAQRAAATPSPVVVATAEPRPAEGAVTITFMPLGNTLGLKPFRDAARRFHAAHPDVVVEIKNPSSTADSIAGLAEQADCFQYIPYLDNPETLTAILSLEPFLEAEPSFDPDDFFPLLLTQYRRDGEIWGLPAEAQPYVIEYNQDLFDAVGREYSRADWTLDDFLTLGQDLTWGEGENKQYGFVGTTYEMLDLLMFVERLGGKVLDDAQDPPAATFNDPATMEAVEWYADLYLLHGVRPIFVTEEERKALINHGRAAMWPVLSASMTICGPVYFPSLKDRWILADRS